MIQNLVGRTFGIYNPKFSGAHENTIGWDKKFSCFYGHSNILRSVTYLNWIQRNLITPTYIMNENDTHYCQKCWESYTKNA